MFYPHYKSTSHYGARQPYHKSRIPGIITRMRLLLVQSCWESVTGLAVDVDSWHAVREAGVWAMDFLIASFIRFSLRNLWTKHTWSKNISDMVLPFGDVKWLWFKGESYLSIFLEASKYICFFETVNNEGTKSGLSGSKDAFPVKTSSVITL